MSNLKRTIAQWVPPVLFDLYKKCISKPNENVFDGVYKHLNDVRYHIVYDTAEALEEDRKLILAKIAAYEKETFYHFQMSVHKLPTCLLY